MSAAPRAPASAPASAWKTGTWYVAGMKVYRDAAHPSRLVLPFTV